MTVVLALYGNSLLKIYFENFTMGCMVGFQAMHNERHAFTTLNENWTGHVFYLCARSCNAMYRVRERNIVPLEHMFESSLKLLLCMPKCLDMFQVLKFLFFLRVTCVIYACTIKTGVWQVIIAHTTELWKNCSKPPWMYMVMFMYSLQWSLMITGLKVLA